MSPYLQWGRSAWIYRARRHGRAQRHARFVLRRRALFLADAAFARAQQMLGEGAAIIDIGGESTRPGAKPVPLAEEMQRVLPLIERLRRLARRDLG